MNAWEICEKMGFYLHQEGCMMRISHKSSDRTLESFFVGDDKIGLGLMQKHASGIILDKLGEVVAKAFN
jgi:hypothetical protein